MDLAIARSGGFQTASEIEELSRIIACGVNRPALAWLRRAIVHLCARIQVRAGTEVEHPLVATLHGEIVRGVSLYVCRAKRFTTRGADIRQAAAIRPVRYRWWSGK